MKKLAALLLVALTSITPLGCTPTQQGVAIGAGTGAMAGAMLSHHRHTRGAAIGAVAGGLIGGLIGHSYEYDRYCPACGRRFHSSKQFCPYDGQPLMLLR